MRIHPRVFVFVVFVILLCATVNGGSPIALRAPGQPYVWPSGGRNIPFNPDRGGLGPMNNAQAVAQTTAAFKAWEDIPSATATHVNAGLLPFDVDASNFLTFLFTPAPDGLNPIVYDENGEIFESLFGPESGVLGITAVEWVNPQTGDILECFTFLNGSILGPPFNFELIDMMGVQVHELGHFQGLDHSQVNGAIFVGDDNGPSPFNPFPPIPFDPLTETMYPFLLRISGQEKPDPDDIAIFSRLYPEPNFATDFATISGRVIGPNNTSPVSGINVIARNIDNPYRDAVSSISGDYSLDGTFTLGGLTPGARYAVYIDQLFIGDFAISRTLPGPEEFYNGPRESNDRTTDSPVDFTQISAGAGQTAGGINIIINRPPAVLPLADDDSMELFPRFPIELCGFRVESIFVNSNGNLTLFGPSFIVLESAIALLNNNPRIAALWDDLNPESGGSVSWSETNDSFTVAFNNVPEFPATGSNSFTMTIFAPAGGSGNRFEIRYGNLTARDGLAGYSCGRATTSQFELEQDLSALGPRTINGHQKTAMYEWFTAFDNDLNFHTLDFLGPKAFEDEFSRNDSIREADVVTLPFSTATRFSAIDAGDLDFYRFRASAGETLVVETVPGSAQTDTLIGLFDATTGARLADDDDGGSGFLSRLIVGVPYDGTFAVGVTTFGDDDFTGAKFRAGRYVLSIRSYRGARLLLTDNGSTALSLSSFAFPFQGTNWTSLFVNANGNVSFGAAVSDATETVPEFRFGPPRIATLWDDLSPQNGLVFAEEKDGALNIHFASVPEALSDRPNYFTTVLDRSGVITMDYGATSRSDGLVGVTQGAGAPDPGATDLSEASRLDGTGTTYQLFNGILGAFDLSFHTLQFKK